MSLVLSLAIAGIATGSIYGLAGTGLVLTYRTTGIFNFALGATAAAAAYIFYWLHNREAINWPVALVLSILIVGVGLGLIFERCALRLASKSVAIQIVFTAGVILLVTGLATIKYGPDPILVPAFLPHAQETFRLVGVNVSYQEVTVTGVALVAVVLLYTLLRYTGIGLAMRGVVDNPNLLAMQAVSPTKVRRSAWILGTCFAALCGILLAPLTGLDSTDLTLLIVQSFGAAAIGAFSSIPMTFVGGIVVGVVASISTKWATDFNWLTGVPEALPFIVLFIVLLVLPKRKLTRVGGAASKPSPDTWKAPVPVRLGFGAMVLVLLAFVPQLAPSKLPFFTVGMVYLIILLSVGMLMRLSGQVSLCQATFAAIGAVAFSQFTVDHGVPWLVAVLLAGLVAVPVGAIVAIPAIRLSGLFLALSTLGFGILVQQLLYSQGWMFTTLAQGRKIPRPSIGASPEGYFYVVLIAALVATGIYILVSRSRLGRLLRGMSDSSVAVTSMGLSVNITRVIIFCISAFLAAIAGVLYSATYSYASGSDPFFDPMNSLLLLVMVAVAPFTEPWFAVVPAIGMVLPGYIHGSNVTYWLNVLFGLSAIAVAVQKAPATLPVRVRGWLDALGGRRRRTVSAPRATVAYQRPVVRVREGTSGLEVTDLTVQFGGLLAVDGLDFSVPLDRITGLIGPNGAGKTTTFDACSGLNRRYRGKVCLYGADVTSVSPAGRARLGLGRTFQRFELCDNLSVIENVRLSRECSQAGGNVLRQLVARPGDKKLAEVEARNALEVCGIAEMADAPVGLLSTGHRRLVELARCLAGEFDVLLLDEPTSGLDRAETTQFAETLRRVSEERRVGLLVVEHDMSFVMNVCSYIYVMDFGRLIFEGPPNEVAGSDIVRSAYLGTQFAASAAVTNGADVTPGPHVELREV